MEQWDLLDENGNPTGRTMIRGEVLRPGQYHLVEHIWVVDRKGRILIQRRADHLRLMPGMWAATGGSAVAGEASEDAARRELSEELSICTVPGELRYGGRMRRRNSFTDIWVLYRDIDPATLRLQEEEVAAVKWVTPEELIRMLRDRSFHHYGSAYFQFVFRAIERCRRTLYVSDLDGTLMSDENGCSVATEDTVNQLIGRGMLVSIATQRGIIGTDIIRLNRIRFRIPVILLGGVLLYDLYRHRILQCCEMPSETVSAVLATFAAAGRSPLLFRRRGNEVHIYYTAVNRYEQELLDREGAYGQSYERFFHRVGQLKETPAIFFSSQGPYEEQLELKEHLARVPGIRTVLYRDIYHPGNALLEIGREDADKGHAVERLREYTGAERIVVFGDSENDLSMFRVADLCCCVEGGSPAAKAVADRLIGSNTEEAVPSYLNEIYHRKV